MRLLRSTFALLSLTLLAATAAPAQTSTATRTFTRTYTRTPTATFTATQTETATATLTHTAVPTTFPTPIIHYRGDLRGQSMTLAAAHTCNIASCRTAPVAGRLGSKTITITQSAGTASYDITCEGVSLTTCATSCSYSFTDSCNEVAVFINTCAACVFTIEYLSTGDY